MGISLIDQLNLEFNKVVRGIAQETPNRYTITDEIKNSGVDLRFQVKIEHRFDATQPRDGVAYFFVSREGPDQSLQKDYLGPFANTSERYPERYGSIGQYQVQTLNCRSSYTQTINLILGIHSLFRLLEILI